MISAYTVLTEQCASVNFLYNLSFHSLADVQIINRRVFNLNERIFHLLKEVWDGVTLVEDKRTYSNI